MRSNVFMHRWLIMGGGATFDWTLFNNSNQRKVVQRPSKVVMCNLDLV
jgi:hypothetical protein